MKSKITLMAMGLFASFSLFAQQKSTHSQKRSCSAQEIFEQKMEKNPSIRNSMLEMEAFTQRKVSEMANLQGKIVGNVIQIPVVVHVLHTNSTNNISNAQIQSQINVLNADFRRTNSDRTNKWSQAADSQIEFYLAKVDPNGNATTGITRKRVSKSTWNITLGEGDDLKKASRGGVSPWNTSEYLNMWIVDNIIRNTPQGTATILGFAQFPWDTDASTDGVVMADQYFGTSGTARAPFDGGRTTTHEVGHYFGLRHIWGDGGCGVDDLVSDTPTSDAPNYGCVTGHRSCGSEDMVQNYMDYSDDSCMNLFTLGQKNRMRSYLNAGGARRALALSDKTTAGSGGGGGNPTPVSYCASKGNRSSFEWIDNIELGGIRNRTASNNGYGNFTSQTGTLARGSSNSMTVSAGFSGTAYTEFWAVWIDFNQNGTFENSEKVVSGSSSSANNLSATVNVPSNATLGTTRMRVSMKYNAAQTPCETFADGEVEDYSIRIVSSGSVRTDSGSVRELGNEKSLTLAVYPNPANDYVALRMNKENISLASYRIVNTIGQTIQAGGLKAERIDISKLNSGLYILEVNDGQKSFVTKLVKK